MLGACGEGRQGRRARCASVVRCKMGPWTVVDGETSLFDGSVQRLHKLLYLTAEELVVFALLGVTDGKLLPCLDKTHALLQKSG